MRIVKGIFKHSTGRIGIVIVILLISIALFAPIIAPFDPYDISQNGIPRESPSAIHILGTDAYGADIFSKLIYGARISLTVGLTTGIIVTLVGAFLGISAGYLGKKVDMLIMRTADLLMVIPGLPLMIILATYMGTRFYMIIFIFTLLGWAGVARLIRAQTLSIKKRKYVLAAEILGTSKLYIIIKHILPAVSPLLIINGVLTSAGIMVAEAGLSFLGFGDPIAISWGKMLQEAQANHGLMFGAWWWVVPPGLAIFVSVLGFMLFGYALEEILNPNVNKVSKKILRKIKLDNLFNDKKSPSKVVE